MVILERPKLGPHFPKMREALGRALGVTAEKIHLKAKTNEGVDAVGRGEAIACHVAATVSWAKLFASMLSRACCRILPNECTRAKFLESNQAVAVNPFGAADVAEVFAARGWMELIVEALVRRMVRASGVFAGAASGGSRGARGFVGIGF